MSLGAEQSARIDLAAAHRLCAREGLVEGLWNHISFVLADAPLRMLVTPNDRHWSLIAASDMLEVAADGTRLSGSDWPNESTAIIHAPVHEARPDARCLIHVHATSSTALFMRKNVVLETRASQSSADFHGRVAYFDLYDGPLTDRSEGERMAAALGGAQVLVLRNHGVLVAGGTVGQAFSRLYAFERACQLQLLAQAPGATLNLIPEPVVEMMQAQDEGELAETEWQGWRELLDATDSGYRR